MKYVIVLGDGMADEAIEELSGKTVIEHANTPCLDRLSKESEIGMVHTIPEGMKPGSDTANLSVLGYDPKKYYSGRSPLEALSIGVPMLEDDIAIRCNIVTISEDDKPFEEKIIIDHSADEISTEECAILLNAVKEQMETEIYHFYVGTSYRHCLIWNRGQVVELTPPHDVLTQVIGQYLPENEALREMMKKSYDILKDHPVNQARKAKGLKPANCCWFWGAGTKPMLSSFEEKTGIKGMMISAVDLLKGIAVGASMGVVEVEGANGGLHTNYAGKTEAALKALLEDEYDFVYIHVEAPDEMGHQGSLEKKLQAVEYLDEKVIMPLTKELDDKNVPYRLLVLPDHPTPIRLRTHTAENVPYLLYDSTDKKQSDLSYCEKDATKSGVFIAEGHTLIDHLFEK